MKIAKNQVNSFNKLWSASERRKVIGLEDVETCSVTEIYQGIYKWERSKLL
jgi:hypothetical protein